MTFRVSARVTVALALAIPLAAAGQTRSQPRTPDGRPDLQGVWDFRTVTPLERPEDLSDRAFLTEEEAAEIETGATERRNVGLAPSEVRTEPLPAGGEGAAGGQAVGGYNEFWFDRGTNVAGNQTSLIIDPSDGRLPALTPRGESLHQIGSPFEDLPMSRPVRVRTVGAGVDHPEDRGLAERCLVGFNAGPPMIQGGYNNYMQLFQTPDTVVIYNEMVHDARIVPLDDRPQISNKIQQWTGQSRGHWDGDTLVIVTTNLSDLRASYEPSSRVAIGTGSTMTLTERFRRLDDDTLQYEYTVDDPTIFTQDFTVSFPMQRINEPLFEYACHEGNYGLLNILLGARTDELK